MEQGGGARSRGAEVPSHQITHESLAGSLPRLAPSKGHRLRVSGTRICSCHQSSGKSLARGHLSVMFTEPGPVLGGHSPRPPRQAGAGGDMLGGQEAPEARGQRADCTLLALKPSLSSGWGVGIKESPSGLKAGQARHPRVSDHSQCEVRGVEAGGPRGEGSLSLVWSSLWDEEAPCVFPEKGILAPAHRVMERTLVSNANGEQTSCIYRANH